MKIIVAPVDYGACGFYRIIQPYRLLGEQDGFDVHFLDGLMDRSVLDCDIFVTQRPTHEQNLRYIRGVREQTKAKIVIDLDDHLHALPPSNPLYSIYRTGMPANKILEQSLQLCDVWTTASESMSNANEYRKNVPRAEVFENAISDGMFDAIEKQFPSDLAARPKREGQVRIGWAGSNTHTADLLSVKDAIVKVMREDESVRFVLYGYYQPAEVLRYFPPDLIQRFECGFFSMPKASMRDLPVLEQVELFFQTYYEALAKLEVDVMIAPLVSNTFNNAKSPLKILESAVAGYPVVASSTGPYRKYSQEGYGLASIACDTRDWVGSLKALINSPERRVGLVTANRQHIRRNHLASHRTEAYAGLMRSLQVAGQDNVLAARSG